MISMAYFIEGGTGRWESKGTADVCAAKDDFWEDGVERKRQGVQSLPQ